MKHFRKLFASLLMMVSAMSLSPAMAQDAVLDQAKAQGIIGETFSGYIQIVDDSRATSDVRRRVDEVNAKRLSIYTETSKRTGESVRTIAALTAEKQIARAAPGEVVKPGENEAWTKKQ